MPLGLVQYVCIQLGLNEAQVILFLRGVKIITSEGGRGQHQNLTEQKMAPNTHR